MADRPILFENATVYVDAERKAGNLLVENGKVSGYDVDPSSCKAAEVIDLKGGFAYPGFNDSHVHLLEIGAFHGCADLQGCSTADQIVKVVGELDEKLPEGELLLGNGFYPDDYDAWSLEDLEKLDKATTNRPTLLLDQLGHNFIINSVSMQKCGITADTPVPLGGKVVLQNGSPTGMFRETAMLLAGNTIFEMVRDETIRTGAGQLFKIWASMGYTSIVDLMGAPFGRIFNPELCRRMEKAGELPLRINYRYTFFNLDEMENCLPCVGKDTDMVRFTGLKLFVDGAYAGGEAWTTWQNLAGNNGLHCVYFDDTYGKQYNINRIVERANELGLNIHYHTQGDWGIGVVLDALEKVIAEKGQLASTHTFIHLAFPTDEQIERMKKLYPHVNTTVQPGFWAIEEESERYYGERAKRCYPVKKLVDSGIPTGMATDFSVSPLELTAPTEVMRIAMSGAGDPANHAPPTMKDLVAGFSLGSAATTAIPDTGILEPGYWADFVVYARDLFDVAPEELNAKNPEVLSTWVGGKKTF